jgi:hypothetical protein
MRDEDFRLADVANMFIRPIGDFMLAMANSAASRRASELDATADRAAVHDADAPRAKARPAANTQRRRRRLADPASKTPGDFRNELFSRVFCFAIDAWRTSGTVPPMPMRGVAQAMEPGLAN